MRQFEKKNVFYILKLTAIVMLVPILFISKVAADSSIQLTMDNNKAPAPVYLVAFAQDTLANDWRLEQVREVERVLATHPSIRFIVTDGKGQTAKQILDIEDLIAKGVDVLITSPRDAHALEPVISHAYQQGVSVVLLDRRIESENFTVFVAPDNRDIARKAARYLGKKHPLGGRILMLKGVENATPTIHRTQGFIEELKKFKRLKVVAEKTANYLRGDAIKAVEEVLNAGIQFDIIYAQSDSMAIGARIVLKNAGIDLNKITIIGIDYIDEARTAIRAGEQDVSFTYPTCGTQGANYVLSLLKGKKVPKKTIIESEMVSIENVDRVKPIF